MRARPTVAALLLACTGCASLSGLTSAPSDGGAPTSTDARARDADRDAHATPPETGTADAGHDAPSRVDALEPVDAARDCALSPVVVLASGQAAPTGIATITVSGTNYLYWADTSSSSLVSFTGGAAEVVATAQPQISQVAVSAVDVYWTTPTSVLRCTLGETCTPEYTEAFDAGGAVGIAVTAESLFFYWTGEVGGTGALIGANKVNPGQRFTLAKVQTVPPVLATDQANRYVAFADDDVETVSICATLQPKGDSGATGGCPDGGPRVVGTGAVGASLAFAPDLDGGAPLLYWSSGSPSAAGIFACAASGCPSSGPVKLTSSTGVAGLAVDDSYVYWTNPTDQTVAACPTSGCLATRPIVLAVGQVGAYGIAVDSDFVYWTTTGSSAGGVYKVPKPSGCQVPP